jgi:hypothetical protein
LPSTQLQVNAEVILKLLLFHSELLLSQLSKALRTTLAPREWEIILTLSSGQAFLKLKSELANIGTFALALLFATFQPAAAKPVSDSQLKRMRGMVYPL